MNRATFLCLAVLSPMLMALPSIGKEDTAKDIVDTAVEAGSFKTLVAAVKAAGLAETLKSDGPFTVFAPTDNAFAKLPKETIADLLKPENKSQLRSILTYHVVPGKVLAGDLLKVREAETVQGSPATFGLTVQGAKVVTADIECANGVIHVIDSVIMPPTEESEQEAKQVTSQSANPREMIRLAVSKGSDLYNSGHACQCADLYMQTMKTLAKSESVPHEMRRQIGKTMHTAKHTSSSDHRAWMLRRGLDTLYDAM